MRTLLLSVAMLSVTTNIALAQEPFYLKPNDHVLFYGDSITEQSFYTNIIETYAVTRYPDLSLTFTNSGWGGDAVSGGGGGPISQRIERDILPYHPSVMTIMLGMNDGHYRAADEDNERQYFEGFRHILATVNQQVPNLRITLIQPSPYDDVTRPPIFPGGYAAVIAGFAQWIEAEAKKQGDLSANMNGPVTAMLEKADQLDPSTAKQIIPDRVHPSFAGHLVMAEQVLKAWNARSVVSSVTLDAAANKPRVIETSHTKITELQAEKGLSWTELDDALPLPMPQWKTMNHNESTVSLVLQSSDFIDALDRQIVKVIHLPDPIYALHIDGKQIAVFSREELERGVNLALLDTPMTAQSKRVYHLAVAHNGLHYVRWRSIQVPFATDSFPNKAPAMNSLDSLEKDIVVKERKEAIPAAHQVQLIPIS